MDLGKIAITDKQFKECENYSKAKTESLRDQLLELIGKKGEFLVYNFLKERLKIKDVKKPDLEIYSRKEKKEMKENKIMINDYDLLINKKIKLQVKTRYAKPKHKNYLGTIDQVKADKIFFTIKNDDVIFTNKEGYVAFVLVSNENEGLVCAILPTKDCNKLIGKVVDSRSVQLHVPAFKFEEIK